MSFWKRLFGIEEVEKPAPKRTPSAQARASAPQTAPAKKAPEPQAQANQASLRMQLFSTDAAQLFAADAMIKQALSPHLLAVLVEDVLGASEHTVQRGAVASLGLSDADLLKVGRINATAFDLPHVQAMQVPSDAGPIEVFVSNRFYMSAVILTQLYETNEDALVACLTWHHALLHRLTKASSIATWQAMTDLATKISDSAQCQPLEWLSPVIHLYRAADRTLTPITSESLAAYFAERA